MIRSLVVLTLCLAPAVVLAQDSDKVRKAKAENDLEKEVDSVNEKCGTKLTVSVDWASFEANKEEWSRRSISSYCEHPLNNLRRFCEGKHARAYIKKHIETVTCHAAADKAGWAIKMEKGNVHWHVSPDSVNNNDYARKQMMERL